METELENLCLKKETSGKMQEERIVRLIIRTYQLNLLLFLLKKIIKLDRRCTYHKRVFTINLNN